MCLRFWLKGLCGVATSLLVGSTLLMAANESCEMGPPTSASDTSNFPKEASTLLEQLKTQAIQLRSTAAEIQSFNEDGGLIGWQADAAILTRVRHQVNDMDAVLCRLRASQRMALPWQQKAIDRVTPKMIELTDYVEDAIQNLNNNHTEVHILDQRYAEDADYMYQRANTIARSISQFEEYAAARTEMQQLSPKLGIHAAS